MGMPVILASTNRHCSRFPSSADNVMCDYRLKGVINVS